MISLLRRLSVCSALLALAACATSAPSKPGAAASAAPAGPRGGTYGLYLAGQAALDSGDSKTAADYFAQARAADPTADFITERAFTAALLAGDVSGAAAMAPAGSKSTGVQAVGVMTQAVEDLAAGRGADAYQKLSDPSVAPAGAAMLLRPWAAAAAGKVQESLIQPDTSDRMVRMMGQLDQALLLERARRFGEAETVYKALLADSIASQVAAPSYASFLERRGRGKEAAAVYEGLLQADPTDAVLIASRDRAQSGKHAPPMMSIRQGAAQALMGPAAAALSDRQPDSGLIYLRLALRLDPDRSDAWLLAGNLISALGDMDAAREAFSKVPVKSARYAEARARLAYSYSDDDKPQALRIARETLAQKPGDKTAMMTLAELLRDNQQFDEAAKVLDPVIAALGNKADWRLYYLRAISLERSGRWADAERDLQKALTVRPDQPEVLNYLGYSWVNRGEKVKEGMAMIQRAVDAQPEEGAFVDSLGWAQYRLGRYPEAVQTLEQAVALDAGDAEINDHLGDAYWRVGRKDEARFQWTAVLSLKPDPDIKARAEAKLASPLGADIQPRPPVVASQEPAVGRP